MKPFEEIPDFSSPEFTDYGAAPAIPDFSSPEYTDYGPPLPAPGGFWGDALEVAGQGAGSMARGAYKGTLSLPALVSDPLVELLNRYAGTSIPSMGQSVDALADQAGVLKLEGRPGKLVEDLSGAAGGAVTGANLFHQASKIPAAAQGVWANILRTLGAHPAGQAAAAGAGAYGAHIAKEQGLGEGGQLAAGMLASTAVPAAGAGGSLVNRLASKGGRENTAAQVFRALTDDPVSAIGNIDDALAAGSPLRAPKTDLSVPKYRQPTAAVTGDPGLLSVHETVRSMPGFQPRFVKQESQNNQALLAYLGQKFGPERAQIIATRDAEIAGRIKELARGSRPTNPTPFLSRLDALEMVPRGQDVEARAVIDAVRKEVDSLASRGGPEWLTNPVYLYQGPRKSINAMIDKKMAGDTPLTKNSIALLMKLRSSLDDVIEDGMPGYRDYWMRPFAKLSAAADRREIFDDILERSSATAQTDLGGNPFVQGSRFESAMRRAGQSKGQQRSPLQTLTQSQQGALDAVRTELRKGSMLGAARTRGSDTFKNLTMGALIGKLIYGGGLGDDAPKWVRSIAERIPVKYLGGGTADQEVMDTIADALLDPELAKHLLVKANQMSADSLANALARRMTAASAGSTAVE